MVAPLRCGLGFTSLHGPYSRPLKVFIYESMIGVIKGDTRILDYTSDGPKCLRFCMKDWGFRNRTSGLGFKRFKV